ncbi:MAG: tetratricopeptide repeat protein [Candidatus Sulfotelmatobacter sp.]
MRGLCEFETGEYSQSLADIQRGLSLGAGKQARDEKILRYHEALLLTRSGNFEAALREYAPLAQGKVPNPELLVGIGLAGLRTPLLPRDLRADKQDLFLAAGNAAFLFLSGDETGAQRQFQELFQRFPTAANAHYFYGSLLYPTDPDQAITEFRRELEIAPSNAAAQLMVAWDSLMRNDFFTALAYAEKAESEEPALPTARLVLGRALVETGDGKDGIDLLEKELRLEPDNFEIHLALARAYSKYGRKDDARRERLLCLQMEKSATTHEARR